MYGDPINQTDISGTKTDCSALWRKILDLVYRNKTFYGGGKSRTHGLIPRNRDMYQKGPADKASFDRHRAEYENQRKGLQRRLRNYDKDCGGRGGPPTTSAARQRSEINRWAARSAPTWSDVTGSGWHFESPNLHPHTL